MLRSRFSSLPGAFNENLVPADQKKSRRKFSFRKDFEKVVILSLNFCSEFSVDLKVVTVHFHLESLQSHSLNHLAGLSTEEQVEGR